MNTSEHVMVITGSSGAVSFEISRLEGCDHSRGKTDGRSDQSRLSHGKDMLTLMGGPCQMVLPLERSVNRIWIQL